MNNVGVGIVFRQDSVRAAILYAAGAAPVRMSVIEQHIDQTTDISQTVRTMLPAADVRPGAVVAGVGLRQATVRRIAVPFVRRNDIKKVLNFCIQPLLLTPVEESVFDWYASSQNREGSDLLVCGWNKHAITGVQQRLCEAGIPPRQISLDVFGLLSAYQADAAFVPERTTAVLNLDHDGVVCLVVCRSRAWFCRYIPKTEALGRDVLFTLALAGLCVPEPITTIGLVHTAPAELFADRLRQEGVRQEIIYLESAVSSSVRMDIPEGRTAADFYIETGLARVAAQSRSAGFRKNVFIGRRHALGGDVSSEPVPVVDFIREASAPYAAGQVKRTMRRSLILFGVFLAVGIGNFYAHLFVQEHRYAQLKTHVRDLFRRTLPEITLIVNEEAQLENRLQEVTARLEQIQGIGSHGPLLVDILRELSVGIPTRFRVELTEIQVDSAGIVLSGQVDTERALQGLIRELRQSRIFKQFRIDKTATAESGLVNFRLTIETTE